MLTLKLGTQIKRAFPRDRDQETRLIKAELDGMDRMGWINGNAE